MHITQATKDLLQGDYDIRDGDGVLGVQFGANLKTYFVHPPPYEPVEVRKFPGTCHRKSSSEVTIANGVRVYFFCPTSLESEFEILKDFLYFNICEKAFSR